MAVQGWRAIDDEHVEVEMTWGEEPALKFTMTLAAAGVSTWGVESMDSTTRIGARLLRRVPIGTMERHARNYLVASVLGRANEMEESVVPLLEQLRDDHPVEAEFKRDGLELRDRMRELASWVVDVAMPELREAPTADGRYAQAAAAYVAAIQDRSTAPVRDAARHLMLSEKTTRNYIYKARERGLLTPTSGGKAGGQLTDKARGFLNDAS